MTQETIDGMLFEYEAKNYLGNLDKFNLALCARKRMHEHAGDMLRWRGERRSFYTHLQTMHVDEAMLR